MANTFINEQTGPIARGTIASMRWSSVLGRLVYRDAESEFGGNRGDTINIRMPASFTANTYVRANGLTIQDVTETSVAVTLDTIYDVSVALTTEELELEINEFQRRIIAPAGLALASNTETLVATGLEALGGPAGATTTWDDELTTGTEAVDAIFQAKADLDAAEVPMSPRYIACDALFMLGVLKDQRGYAAQVRGDGGSALASGIVARIGGFDIYVSPKMTANTFVAFHPHAVALVNRAPAVPQGASYGASTSEDGYAARVVMDYDIDKKQEVLSIDVMTSVTELNDDLGVKVGPDA